MNLRAIGIVRVSEAKGREGDRFVSPRDQDRRIRGWCEAEGIELLTVHEEIDISGGLQLEDRPGLGPAVKAIEAGDAEVIVVAYFDRLVREITVQHEIVDRVEAAAGRVVTIDAGEVSNRTAASWLKGTLMGTVHEYYRRQLREKVGEAQADAVARGVVPWNVKIPGYRKGENGVLVPDDQAPITREAFVLRRDGTTIKGVREFLRSHGIDRSFNGTTSLLQSRLVIGEIHFGKLVNLRAHEPIVERPLWEEVQAMRISKGRAPKSKRLLARLGVLRCGICEGRMVSGLQTQNGRRYPFYRCSTVGDCPRRQTIGAEIVEGLVVDAVRNRIAYLKGSATALDRGREVFDALDRAQADLDSGIRAFAGLEGEAAAIERLAQLRAVRDQAQEEVNRVRQLDRRLPDFTLGPDTDWDLLSLEAKRALIVALVDSVIVRPDGRGAERVTITLLEDSPSFRI